MTRLILLLLLSCLPQPEPIGLDEQDAWIARIECKGDGFITRDLIQTWCENSRTRYDASFTAAVASEHWYWNGPHCDPEDLP